MSIMKKRYLILYLLLFLGLPVWAQEPVKLRVLLKEARITIKNSRSQDISDKRLRENEQKLLAAEKKLLTALERNDLGTAEQADIYFTAQELRRTINDQENLRLYLRQPYDTLKFFSTILQIHQYILRCDSVEQAGGKKFVHRKKGREVLLAYRKNLLNGGKYLLQKGRFAEAFPYFDMYLNTVDEPMMEFNMALKADTLLPRVAYWATLSAYNAHQPQEALRYMDYAIAGADSTLRVSLTEYKAQCYLALGDTAQWLTTLKWGVHNYPRHDFFYLHLMNYFDTHKTYAKGLALSDTLLAKVGERDIYWFGKCQMYLGQKDYDRCIESADRAIALDTLFVDAYYNKGIAYLNKAITFSQTASIDLRSAKSRRDHATLRGLYNYARGPMEKVRKLQPEAKQRWAEPLYSIYLNLNMGEEFAAIEKILDEE